MWQITFTLENGINYKVGIKSRKTSVNGRLLINEQSGLLEVVRVKSVHGHEFTARFTLQNVYKPEHD
jgi:hypothetical protein